MQRSLTAFRTASNKQQQRRETSNDEIQGSFTAFRMTTVKGRRMTTWMEDGGRRRGRMAAG
jgi:hypothetical protein